MDSIDVGTIGTAIALLTFMVTGATELVKRLFDRDYRAACIIAVAALVGGVAGSFLFTQVGFALGVVTGLGASGLVTVASKVNTAVTK